MLPPNTRVYSQPRRRIHSYPEGPRAPQGLLQRQGSLHIPRTDFLFSAQALTFSSSPVRRSPPRESTPMRPSHTVPPFRPVSSLERPDSTTLSSSTSARLPSVRRASPCRLPPAAPGLTFNLPLRYRDHRRCLHQAHPPQHRHPHKEVPDLLDRRRQPCAYSDPAPSCPCNSPIHPVSQSRPSSSRSTRESAP